MKHRVEWSKRAFKVLSRLDRPTQDRILAAVASLAESNRGDVVRLRGLDDEAFRLRVGDWRVIFSYLEDATILVHRVGSRGDVYKR